MRLRWHSGRQVLLMPRKKIIFAIVEGPSDEEALAVIMSRIYDRNSVYFHILHHDLTSEFGVEPNNVVSKVGDLVKSYARQNPFKQSDFYQIIHIVDMDGAFVSNDVIVEDESHEKPNYSETEIRTKNKSGIEERNRRKRENLNRLSATHTIWKIPYSIYYMSCNLDHALYGKLNSTDAEKEQDAFQFAKRYRNDISSFLKFINESDFSVIGDYAASWKYIKEEYHSLERHTNLGICFDKVVQEESGK